MNNDGHNFQCTKFLFNDFVLTHSESWLGKRPKSAFGKSSSCPFSFSAARNVIVKASKYVTFGFYHRILVFFPFRESLKVIFWERYRFFNVLVVVIRKSSDKLPCTEDREGFAVHSSTWPSGAKGEWRVSSWLVVSNTCEKISYRCVLLRLFSGLGIHV